MPTVWIYALDGRQFTSVRRCYRTMKEIINYLPMAVFALLLGASVASGAAPAQGRRIHILYDKFPYASQAFVDSLVTTLQTDVHARVVTGLGLPAMLATDPPSDTLILPDSRVFPLESKPALEEYLQRGGDLIVIGGPAFSRMVVDIGGKWLERDAAAARPPALVNASALGATNEETADKWRAENEKSAAKIT